MEAISAGDFERDGDFDFGEEATRAGGLDLAGEDLEDLDLAGEAARARAGDFSVFDFGCMRIGVARNTKRKRVLLVKLQFALKKSSQDT